MCISLRPSPVTCNVTLGWFAALIVHSFAKERTHFGPRSSASRRDCITDATRGCSVGVSSGFCAVLHATAGTGLARRATPTSGHSCRRSTAPRRSLLGVRDSRLRVRHAYSPMSTSKRNLACRMLETCPLVRLRTHIHETYIVSHTRELTI